MPGHLAKEGDAGGPESFVVGKESGIRVAGKAEKDLPLELLGNTNEGTHQDCTARLGKFINARLFGQRQPGGEIGKFPAGHDAQGNSQDIGTEELEQMTPLSGGNDLRQQIPAHRAAQQQVKGGYHGGSPQQQGHGGMAVIAVPGGDPTAFRIPLPEEEADGTVIP
jgi:hypothetical protein